MWKNNKKCLNVLMKVAPRNTFTKKVSSIIWESTRERKHTLVECAQSISLIMATASTMKGLILITLKFNFVNSVKVKLKMPTKSKLTNANQMKLMQKMMLGFIQLSMVIRLITVTKSEKIFKSIINNDIIIIILAA